MTVPVPEVVFVELTAEELASKTVGSHNLQKAVEALHRDGLVVLQNAVRVDHLERLNARMVPEAQTLYARPDTHRNFGGDTGNIQQEPVLERDYLFADVLANPWAAAVVQCMFGPRPSLRFYSANTAFRAPDRQPVHIDIDFDFPRVPLGYFVNIGLVDTTPANGATEVWLGSHVHTDRHVLDPARNNDQVRDSLLDERRRISPPLQPCLPRGSLVIRDFRLWHAGRPNQTDEPRVMLVTALFPPWYRSDLKMKLPRDADGCLDWGDIVPCVDWFDEGYDYLRGAHDHDFALKA